MANQVNQYRDGATVTTIFPPAYPHTTERPVLGYVLNSQPKRASAHVVKMHWDVTPAALFNLLMSIPLDREVDIWAPMPTGGGPAVRWGWMRGTFQQATKWDNRNRFDFGPTDWQLNGAREV